MPTRLPAEWEPHCATWLGTPRLPEQWGNYFSAAVRSMDELAGILGDAGGESVKELVPTGAATRPSQRSLPYGDIWLRDIAPLFAVHDGAPVAVAFSFNGWGGKFIMQGDTETAAAIAHDARIRLVRHPLILEGGAIDSDGQGTLLTTRQCLLNPNRNPNADEGAWETVFAETLGIDRVIWLPRGLVGDHTDGHVDNIARFVGPEHVVCMEPGNANDPNAARLAEVRKALTGAKSATGQSLELTCLPSPGRIEGPEGILAASYCNFFIANQCVVVPIFGVTNDEKALQVFASLFPNRQIVPFDARALLTGGGTVHCVTMQQPLVQSGGNT